MLSRLLLAVCAGSALIAADPAADGSAGQAPWTNAFTMMLRGAERQFVDHAGKTYLLLRIDDVVGGVGDGQDVAFTGKLRRLPGDKFSLYRLDGVAVVPVGEALAGRLDGDNLHLMGRMGAAQGGRILSVDAVAPAASDAQLLHERMAGIGDEDWDRRIAVANWCQEQAVNAGNADFWNATADSLLSAVVTGLGAKAAERKDLALVTRAVDLALNRLRDPGLAARTSSPAWIREHGGAQAEALARRMRSLGYSLYKDEWLPRTQALDREYEDRFAAISWKDAEGYYRLGRWVDDNAEAITRARERSWRCYQAGFAADPGHPGIARELGVQPQLAAAADSGTKSTAAAASTGSDFIDPDTGLRVPVPAGWKRGAMQGQATIWNDPNSDTGTISVVCLHPPVDFDAQVGIISAEAQQRPGYLEISSNQEPLIDRRIMRLASSWNDGQQQRYAQVALVHFSSSSAPAVVIQAQGAANEQEALERAISTCIQGCTYQPGTAPAAPPPPPPPPAGR